MVQGGCPECEWHAKPRLHWPCMLAPGPVFIRPMDYLCILEPAYRASPKQTPHTVCTLNPEPWYTLNQCAPYCMWHVACSAWGWIGCAHRKWQRGPIQGMCCRWCSSRSALLTSSRASSALCEVPTLDQPCTLSGGTWDQYVDPICPAY